MKTCDNWEVADRVDSDNVMAEARRGTCVLAGSALDDMTESASAQAHDPVVQVGEGVSGDDAFADDGSPSSS